MFKKIAFTFGIKMIIAVLNLAIVVLLSRYLGAAGKGEASLILTSIAMLLLFCNLVGGSSLVYFVPRYNMLQLFLLSNGWSLIVCAMGYFVLKNAALISPDAVLPVVLLSAINSFLATNLTILLGKEKINTHNLVSLLQTFLNIAILFFMIKGMDRANVNSYIISLYVALGVCLVVSSIFVFPLIKKDTNKRKPDLFSELAKFGIYNQAGHVMKFISFRYTYYLLAGYSGDVILGIFSNGVSLIESVFLISNSFATVLYPKVSNSGDPVYSQKLTLQLTKFSILLCFITLIPLVLLPSAFFVWLFGSEFSGVHQVIVLLAPGILCYNVALVIGHYFSGTGKYKVNTIANFIGLATTLLLVFMSAPYFGIREIGIISTLSYITTTAFVIFYFVKEAKIKSYELLPVASDLKFLWKEAVGMFKR